MSFRNLLAAAAVLGAAAACSQDTPAPAVRFLDRPADLAFGCTAELPRDGGTSDIVAVPTSSCAPFTPDAGADGVDAAQQVRDNVSSWGFVIEGARGDVALAKLDGFGELRDSDPLTPGLNGLPVGRLPVEIATLPDGCFVVTANQGSCDLGMVDVFGAIAVQQGVVSRELVMSGAQPLAAAPSAIVAAPQLTYEDRTSCTAPAGLVYVAYPSCQAVAVVDTATTQVVASVTFAADGTPSIGGADLACPVDCDSVPSPRTAPAADGPQPQTLALEPDGSRLYIGSFTGEALTIVDLDPATGLPAGTLESVALEAGAIGLERVAATGPVEMGNGSSVGTFSFVYGIARDDSIRVIDVTPARPAAECDAQVDPRALHDISDVSAFACLPIGFPRRAGARGPGIRLPFDAVPRDVTFLKGNVALGASDQPDPNVLLGVFALISAENPLSDQPRGAAYYVNVDDDNYEDFEDAENLSLVDLPLALPHQLRDDTPFRRALASGCGEVVVQRTQGPLRFSRLPAPTFLPVGYEVSTTGVTGDRFLPQLRRRSCNDGEAIRPTFQLSSSSPAELRERLIPDLAEVLNETWEIAWEGAFSQDSDLSIKQGGQITVLDAGRMRLDDQAGEFCDVGVEPGDFVRLVGCTSDFDCGFGEICYVHPEAPEGSSGMCLIPGREVELAEQCRDVLVTSRRYTVVDVADGQLKRNSLTLVPRPVTLPSTPAGGCDTATQCTDIEESELTYLESLGDFEFDRHTWTCATDPAYPVGEKRCQMTCETSDTCAAGSVCDAGRCVLGAIPAAECVGVLQRYEPRVGDAFSVVGSVTGYRNHRILDVASGECVDDPTASPLVVGRFHKVEPECPADEDLTTETPNPCSFAAVDEPSIELRDEGGGVFAEVPTVRETHAIRFRMPGLTIEIADVLIPLPGQEGELYSPVPSGYEVSFELGGGFIGRNILLEAALPERMRPAPDGAVWVVDGGDQGTLSVRRGQLLKVTDEGQDPNVRLF